MKLDYQKPDADYVTFSAEDVMDNNNIPSGSLGIDEGEEGWD